MNDDSEKTKICCRKDCEFGGKPQPLSNFRKDKNKPDGHRPECKSCTKKYEKQYYEDNKDDIKEKSRNNHNKNRTLILVRQKEYYDKTAEERKKYQHEKNNSPLESSSVLAEILLKYGVDEAKLTDDGLNVMVKCFKCGEFFIPKYIEAKRRVDFVLGKTEKEGRFYCSTECRKKCSVFGKTVKTIEKSVNNSHLSDFSMYNARMDNVLRTMVFVRDNYTCVDCGHVDKTGKTLVGHHIIPISMDPIFSADIDNIETLCLECHEKKHMNNPNCTFSFLQKNSIFNCD